MPEIEASLMLLYILNQADFPNSSSQYLLCSLIQFCPHNHLYFHTDTVF